MQSVLVLGSAMPSAHQLGRPVSTWLGIRKPKSPDRADVFLNN